MPISWPKTRPDGFGIDDVVQLRSQFRTRPSKALRNVTISKDGSIPQAHNKPITAYRGEDWQVGIVMWHLKRLSLTDTFVRPGKDLDQGYPWYVIRRLVRLGSKWVERFVLEPYSTLAAWDGKTKESDVKILQRLGNPDGMPRVHDV